MGLPAASFAANYFKQKGYTVIDADLITKTLLEDEVVLSEIKKENHFKEAFSKWWKLDKRILADIIFKTLPKKKAILEANYSPG